jgi:hypothetical protein
MPILVKIFCLTFKDMGLLIFRQTITRGCQNRIFLPVKRTKVLRVWALSILSFSVKPFAKVLLLFKLIHDRLRLFLTSVNNSTPVGFCHMRRGMHIGANTYLFWEATKYICTVLIDALLNLGFDRVWVMFLLNWGLREGHIQSICKAARQLLIFSIDRWLSLEFLFPVRYGLLWRSLHVMCHQICSYCVLNVLIFIGRAIIPSLEWFFNSQSLSVFRIICWAAQNLSESMISPGGKLYITWHS